MSAYDKLLNQVKASLSYSEGNVWDHAANFIRYDDRAFSDVYVQEDDTLLVVICDGREYPEAMTPENIVAANLHEKLLEDLGFYA